MIPGKLKPDNPTVTVWDDEREPEMLAHGLTLSDPVSLEKRAPNEPRRRTLDDMRRLSDHIKKTRALKKALKPA